jgi:hypothetical protein
VAVVSSVHREALYVCGEKILEKSSIIDTDIVRAVIGTVCVYKYAPETPYGDFPFDLEDVLRQAK